MNSQVEFIGLPGAGKTTLLKDLFPHLEHLGYLVIKRPDLRYNIFIHFPFFLSEFLK